MLHHMVAIIPNPRAAGKSKWVGNLADHMADWIWEGIWIVGADDDDDDLEGV